MLLEFARAHPRAAEPLDNWYRRAKKATWENLAGLKQDYPQVDLVGKCTVFTIGGNKYRLITRVKYLKRTLFIRAVLTHRDYTRGEWKNDCGS
ncbi:MAG TPA: type II toxin-antitoxin system HigB family toxin [Blastocatellia bacterium]|nr:type II toxin-antitoxin system HigB family toxin [Blastocatellia bacterium]